MKRNLAFLFIFITHQVPAAPLCVQKIQQFFVHTPKHDLTAFIQKLPKTPLPHPQSLAGSGQEMILQSRNQSFWGKLWPLSPAGAEIELYLFKDARGQVHFFDNKHLEQAQAFLPQKNSYNPEDIPRLHPLYSPLQGHVDIPPLRERICRHYRALSALPEFSQISQMALATPHPRLRYRELAIPYLSHCLGGIFLIAAGENLGTLIATHLKPYPAAHHVKNFSVGLPLMLVMDQCLKGLRPSAHQEILMATLGVNILGNIYYEIDLPGLWQPNFVKTIIQGRPLQETKDTVTDEIDFATGMLATFLYFHISHWIEGTSGIRKARLCG